MKRFLEHREDRIWLSQRHISHVDSRHDRVQGVLNEGDELNLSGENEGSSEKVAGGNSKQE
jgi:hypothetical protein